jgi:hypothetical protein
MQTTNLGVRSSNLFGRASNVNDLGRALALTWLFFGSSVLTHL